MVKGPMRAREYARTAHFEREAEIFLEGVFWLLNQIEQEAIRPEVNSVTQFEPYIELREIKEIVSGTETM